MLTVAPSSAPNTLRIVASLSFAFPFVRISQAALSKSASFHRAIDWAAKALLIENPWGSITPHVVVALTTFSRLHGFCTSDDGYALVKDQWECLLMFFPHQLLCLFDNAKMSCFTFIITRSHYFRKKSFNYILYSTYTGRFSPPHFRVLFIEKVANMSPFRLSKYLQSFGVGRWNYSFLCWLPVFLPLAICVSFIYIRCICAVYNCGLHASH